MTGKNDDCPCCKIMECPASEDCPVKGNDSGKNCWEINFLDNKWEKVFEKCRDCKVFKLTSRKLRRSSPAIS